MSISSPFLKLQLQGHWLRSVVKFHYCIIFSIASILLHTDKAASQENIAPADLIFNNGENNPETGPENAGEAGSSKAQRTKLIETDRNSYTFSRQTLAAGQTITETSYSYIKVGREGAKHSYPELIMRHGLTDDIEFRFGYNFESEKGSGDPESEIVNKFGINAQQQAFYGVKFQLTEQLPENLKIPDTAFMINGRSPIGSIEKHGQIGLGYAFGWELPNRMNFDGALLFGTERFKADNYFSWSPSTVLKIPLGPREKWFTQVEYFGLFSSSYKNNFALNFIDTGLHYFITDNWEIGTIVGTGVNESARGIFLNFGTGIR
ncbi:MAG: hypothetical protein ACKO85_00325, partial [Isosphaeraceae bacterium]